jgi:RHH-type proline utilization regulon transcriptional repressor/proline dehydrogenase/delta 1-pyrroline-5-carboxylate dehydrogenase
MAELVIGNPDRLATDVGPVISDEAQDGILRHVAEMRAKGRAVHAMTLPDACRDGSFVAPTLIEIASLAELDREVFGPVLHVVRYRRDGLDGLVREINESGYGLTFGVHTRIDETVARVTRRIEAGNIYVNRNIVGAVVGVQPFGGHGLSGTGPKAGGPLYLLRLLAERPRDLPGIAVGGEADSAAGDFVGWLRASGRTAAAARCAAYLAGSRLGAVVSLPGPVGERNIYALEARGVVLCVPQTEFGLLAQIGAALATGNRAAVFAPGDLGAVVAGLPEGLCDRVTLVADRGTMPWAAVLFEGDGDGLRALNREMAAMEGAIAPVFGVGCEALAAGAEEFPLVWLLRERSVSTNTAAAGGNASLMTIG